MRYSTGRILLLLLGCVVLGVGVAMLLTADLGSDGYSTLVNGVALALDISFWTANLAIGVLFVGLAAARRLYPGLGTVVQVAVVGGTVSVLLEVMSTPDGLPARIVLLAAAFPVLAWGIAAYLGSRTGAGPTEAAALAWDPPVPFKWSYSVFQFLAGLIGWLCGATFGVGTVVVVVLIGPVVARLLPWFTPTRRSLTPEDV